MTDPIARRLVVLFASIFAILAVIAVFAVRYIGISGTSSDWMNHAYATVHEIDGIGSSLQSGDGAMRAFALSGDPRDRAASKEAFDEMAEHFDVAKPLTRDDPATTAAVLALEAGAQKRLDLAQSVWAAREQNQAARVQTLLATDAGSGEMADIKRSLAKMRDDQFAKLAEAEKAAYRDAQTTRWVVGTGLVTNVVLLLVVSWLIRDDLTARRLVATTLGQANTRLESEVRNRTAELVAANEDLKAKSLESQWAALAMEHQLRYNNIIVNSVGELVFVLTKALRITRINPAVTQLTGLGEPELLNQPLDKVIQLDSSAAGGTPALDVIARSLRNGRELRGLAAVVTDKKNNRIPVRINVLPLRDRDKVVGGVVLVERTASQ